MNKIQFYYIIRNVKLDLVLSDITLGSTTSQYHLFSIFLRWVKPAVFRSY